MIHAHLHVRGQCIEYEACGQPCRTPGARGVCLRPDRHDGDCSIHRTMSDVTTIATPDPITEARIGVPIDLTRLDDRE